MISVKVLGWLGKQLKLNSIELPSVPNTNELFSLLNNLYPKFTYYLKQMSFNQVYYVVFVNGQPFHIIHLLNNAIPLRDSVFIEFVPYFKFNAGYYKGISTHDLLAPSKTAPFFMYSFASKLFSWLNSNPLKAEDNEPYREVFKQRQKEYEDFAKSLYEAQSKGDFISESNTIEYGQSIPLVYGKIKYQGKTIINNVVTSIVPKISSSTLKTMQNNILNSHNGYFNSNNNDIGGTVSLDVVNQLSSARNQNLNFAVIEKAQERWLLFEKKFNNNDSYQLNQIVYLKDNNQQIITESTPNLSFKTYGLRPARYHDEGGGAFFFFMYYHLVGEMEQAFKELRESILQQQDQFLIKFQNESTFNKFMNYINTLHFVTSQIRADAVSVYNYADSASGMHHFNIQKREISRLIFKVFGLQFVNEQRHNSYVADWTTTQGDYLEWKTEYSYDYLHKLNGDFGERGVVLDLINKIKNIQG